MTPSILSIRRRMPGTLPKPSPMQAACSTRFTRKYFVDSQVTRGGIESVVGEFLASSGVEDQVILFLAGHAFLDENLGYWFGTVDVDPNDLSKRGMSFDQIERVLERVPARRRLILLDTCHAGDASMIVANRSRQELREVRLFAGSVERVVTRRALRLFFASCSRTSSSAAVP